MNCLNALSRASLVVLACAAIGCSGGDGEGQLTLTAQNVEPVAGLALNANEMLEDMGDLVDGMAEMLENPSAQMIPCDQGNMNLVVNDLAPQGQLSDGDNASLTFYGCMIDVGGGNFITLNGTLSFTAETVVGTEGGPFTLNLSARFSGFTMQAAGVTASINGGFTHELSSTDGQNIVSVIHGDYFSAYAGNGSEAFSGSLKNFRLERQYNESTGSYLWDFDAMVSGSGLGGTVEYETTVPFTGTDPDYPDAGTLVVTGANGGVATVFAVDNVNVRIELDTDGVPPPEFTIDTTWAVIDDDGGTSP